jgi:hypothetical protein
MSPGANLIVKAKLATARGTVVEAKIGKSEKTEKMKIALGYASLQACEVLSPEQ